LCMRLYALEDQFTQHFFSLTTLCFTVLLVSDLLDRVAFDPIVAFNMRTVAIPPVAPASGKRVNRNPNKGKGKGGVLAPPPSQLSGRGTADATSSEPDGAPSVAGITLVLGDSHMATQLRAAARNISPEGRTHAALLAAAQSSEMPIDWNDAADIIGTAMQATDPAKIRRVLAYHCLVLPPAVVVYVAADVKTMTDRTTVMADNVRQLDADIAGFLTRLAEGRNGRTCAEDMSPLPVRVTVTGNHPAAYRTVSLVHIPVAVDAIEACISEAEARVIREQNGLAYAKAAAAACVAATQSNGAPVDGGASEQPKTKSSRGPRGAGKSSGAVASATKSTKPRARAANGAASTRRRTPSSNVIVDTDGPTSDSDEEFQPVYRVAAESTGVTDECGDTVAVVDTVVAPKIRRARKSSDKHRRAASSAVARAQPASDPATMAVMVRPASLPATTALYAGVISHMNYPGTFMQDTRSTPGYTNPYKCMDPAAVIFLELQKTGDTDDIPFQWTPNPNALQQECAQVALTIRSVDFTICACLRTGPSAHDMTVYTVADGVSVLTFDGVGRDRALVYSPRSPHMLACCTVQAGGAVCQRMGRGNQRNVTRDVFALHDGLFADNTSAAVFFAAANPGDDMALTGTRALRSPVRPPKITAGTRVYIGCAVFAGMPFYSLFVCCGDTVSVAFCPSPEPDVEASVAFIQSNIHDAKEYCVHYVGSDDSAAGDKKAGQKYFMAQSMRAPLLAHITAHAVFVATGDSSTHRTLRPDSVVLQHRPVSVDMMPYILAAYDDNIFRLRKAQREGRPVSGSGCATMLAVDEVVCDAVAELCATTSDELSHDPVCRATLREQVCEQRRAAAEHASHWEAAQPGAEAAAISGVAALSDKERRAAANDAKLAGMIRWANVGTAVQRRAQVLASVTGALHAMTVLESADPGFRTEASRLPDIMGVRIVSAPAKGKPSGHVMRAFDPDVQRSFTDALQPSQLPLSALALSQVQVNEDTACSVLQKHRLTRPVYEEPTADAPKAPRRKVGSVLVQSKSWPGRLLQVATVPESRVAVPVSLQMRVPPAISTGADTTRHRMLQRTFSDVARDGLYAKTRPEHMVALFLSMLPYAERAAAAHVMTLGASVVGVGRPLAQVSDLEVKAMFRGIHSAVKCPKNKPRAAPVYTRVAESIHARLRPLAEALAMHMLVCTPSETYVTDAQRQAVSDLELQPEPSAVSLAVTGAKRRRGGSGSVAKRACVVSDDQPEGDDVSDDGDVDIQADTV
jgi:hypothetical protein